MTETLPRAGAAVERRLAAGRAARRLPPITLHLAGIARGPEADLLDLIAREHA